MLTKLDALLETLKKAKDELKKDSVNPALAPKEKKIKDLQARIDAGTYKPDAGKIADKVIQSGVVRKEDDDVEKSNYGPKGAKQYSTADNVGRKATRTGDEIDAAGPNKAVRAVSTKPGQLSAKDQASAEASKYKKMNRKQPVRRLKDMSPEEQEQIKARYKIVKGEDIEFSKSGQWTLHDDKK